MKLLRYSLFYSSVALLFIIGIWATIFYFNMLDEIYDSIDDGLENSKILIIRKVSSDTSLLHKHEFGESNYYIQPLPSASVAAHKDRYNDTLIYMENEEERESVRMLTTTFALDNGKYYQLKIISSMIEEDDLIEDLLYSLLCLYLILVVSIVWMNQLVLKKIWKPFYHLIEYLQSFRLGKEYQPPHIPTKVKEFTQLQSAVTDLLQRNQQTFNSQKQFIENASHELQTPLAISMNKLEWLAEKSTSGEQLETIGEVMDVLQRMTRLNQALLLLSKIENQQFVKAEEVSFNSLFKKYKEDFLDLSQFKQINVILQEEGELIRTVNKDLAEILIGNLLKNAIVHNIMDGEVKIKLNQSSFSIENTGIVKALDKAKLFSRFYKATNQKNNTGLGLSIAKAIADFYGAQMDYRFTSGIHSMTVSFL